MRPTENHLDPYKSGRDKPRITAYCINPTVSMPIVPAHRARGWMDQTDSRFAYRCLPLLMANQSGWFLLNSERVRLTWNGGDSIDSLRVETDQGVSEIASSHFGYGVVTWEVPYLFRTSLGYDLLVRGPANWPKEGIFPLEGLVEVDWLGATFSVNWKMTRTDYEVVFEPDEPIAMLTPIWRYDIEAFQAVIMEIESDPELVQEYNLWESRRLEFIERIDEQDPVALKQGWEKHYFRGVAVSGKPANTHRTKVDLSQFEDRRPEMGQPDEGVIGTEE